MRAAAPLTEQAAVTQWPLRILLVLLTIAVILLVLWALRLGWRRRARHQQIVLPESGAAADVLADGVPVAAKYVGTVSAGDPLDRIVAAGGVAQAEVFVGPPGVLIERAGDGPLLVPAGSIRQVGTAPGLLQRYYGGHGVLLLTWSAAEREVTSGLWFPDPDDQQWVAARLRAILEHREEMA